MKTTIHSETAIGIIHLVVGNLERSLNFYRNSMGLDLRRRLGESIVLGTSTNDLLMLTENPKARPVRGASGLYHYALLVPSRRELARSLQKLIRAGTQPSGFSDHGVSEAIYLSDPDGHGIEIYWDRPRNEWPYENGRLVMTTDRLDVEGILAEFDSRHDVIGRTAPETNVGHIHLHVADLDAARLFYVDVLGFELVARYGPSALFVAAGGYHHHIGLNTWAGVGAPPAPSDSARLKWYEIRLPNEKVLRDVNKRIQKAGVPFTQEDDGLYVTDPAGNSIILTSRNGTG